MATHSVDDLLVKDMQNQQAPVQAIPNEPLPEKIPEPEPASASPPPATDPQDQGVQAQAEQNVPHGTSEPDTNQTQSEHKVDTKASNIDEYGNPIEKPRIYTEEEVQSIINDRMARSRMAIKQQPPTPQQVQKAADDFKADPNSEESWEVQLNSFIDRRLETKQKEVMERQWQQQESQKQADFEAKFNSGMSKYQDFEQVVSKAAPSITTGMMLATRSLDNPAAFIYGAAKLHPAELERISKINDAYVQAAEVGRLHERMVKQRGNVSNAPRPIEAPKGDLPNKVINPQPSLDQRILEHAKQRRR